MAVLTAVTVTISAAACTGSGGQPDASASVGPAGGQVTSPGGAIRLTVPTHAAPAGTKVQIVTGQAPPAVPQSAGFTPLSSFDIRVTDGKLRTGVVSVHYDPRTLAADGSNSDLLVMLVSDHHGGWVALPTTADPVSQTASATWPHFSAGVLGYLKSPAVWLVQHVLTYPLGPVKKPDCSQHKKWSGQDKGWTAANPNWNGGRILLHPLDACVARAPALYGDQRVDVTNRYWYGMTLSLPASMRVDTGDAFDASSLSDALLTELYSKLFGITLVPGHSYAHARVRDNPAGQQITINSYADPVSFVINAILTIGEFASLGETAAARAEIKAAEDELYAGVAAGRETLADVQEKLAAGSQWRQEQDVRVAKDDNKVLEKFDKIMNGYSVIACATDALRDDLSSEGTAALGGEWKDLPGLLARTVASCKTEILLFALGKAFQFANPAARQQLEAKMIEALSNPKVVLSTGEGIAAMTAEIGGQDYLRSRLILTQARDPRLGNPFAGMDWSSFLRPVLGCLPSTGEKWDHVEVSASRYVDVTGDGVPDELLLTACPTSTSANPAQVVVVDGTSTASSPQVIGVLPGVPNGMTNYYSSMSFTTKGTTVTLTGQSYSGNTPMCCPDLMLTITYRWRGGRFVQTRRTVKPVS